MKKGDKIIMYFHGVGVISEEKCKVLKFDDETVTIDDGDDGRKFDRKTGKCLNDNNWGGFYRTIKPCDK
jgi:hypothetical protein